jgi:hypothetical protein
MISPHYENKKIESQLKETAEIYKMNAYLSLASKLTNLHAYSNTIGFVFIVSSLISKSGAPLIRLAVAVQPKISF